MNSGELISIIVPIYNVSQYLDECVDSIVNQTYRNIEIILVDDGSTDDSGTKCDAWQTKDNRIKVLHKKNGGLSDARNEGLKLSIGSYVMFIDSDDVIHSMMCEILLKAIRHGNAQVSVCAYNEYHYQNLSDIVPSEMEFYYYEKKDALNVMMNPTNSFNVVAWNKMYWRRLLEDNPFPVGKIHEDMHVMPKIIYAATKVAYTSVPLYFNRSNPNSITRRKYSLNRLDEIEGVERMLRFYSDINCEEALKRTQRVMLWKTLDHQMYLSAYFPNDKLHYNEVRSKFLEVFDNVGSHDLLSNRELFQMLLCKYVPNLFLKLRYILKPNVI